MKVIEGCDSRVFVLRPTQKDTMEGLPLMNRFKGEILAGTAKWPPFRISKTMEESFENESKGKQFQFVRPNQITSSVSVKLIDGCETASARCNHRSRPIFPAIIVS